MLPQSDSESIFNLGRLDPPDDDGDPISSYDFEDNLKGNPERVESGDDSKGVPAWKIIVKYDQIATVQQTADLFGLVTENDPVRVQYLALEWRQASVENDGILQVWPNAPTITVETRLLTQAAAAAEAARLFDLYSVQRDIWKITVPMSDDPEDDPGIGELVELTSRAGRMGFGREIGSGELFRVLGRVDDFDEVPTLGLTLYGPPRVVFTPALPVSPPAHIPTEWDGRAVFGGRGLLRVNATVVTASDVDVNAWETAVVAAGGSVSTARKALMYTTVSALKTKGIWPIVDGLLILAAENAQSALIDIKTSTAASLSSTPPTFTSDRGYAGNGSTSYINTNYNPFTQGVNLVVASAHLSVWVNTDRGPADLIALGSYVWPNTLDIWPYQSSLGATGVGYHVNSAIEISALANNSSRGFFLAQSDGASFQQVFYNGVSLGSTANTYGYFGIPDLPLFVCGQNNGGGVAGPSTDQISMVSYGGKMTSTQAADYYTIMRAHMTAIGVP
jgi:hypothetical protein